MNVRRVFQPVGIVFKGSGWYVTDSRKGESVSVSAAEPKAESAPKAEGGETKATETKATETKATETKASSDTTTATA
jgi:hypothetical protein